MTSSLAPGLYRVPAEPQRAVRQLVRADVPVFVGYTDRGPVGQPVRLRTLTQFEALFGGGPGFLTGGVKAFFECGGDAVYVIRLASPTARAASAVLAPAPVTWQAEASFAWPMIDPRTLEGRSLPGAQPWISLFEEITRQTGPRSPDAGAWGNQLELRIAETALVRTQTVADVILEDGFAVMVEDLPGLEAASILTLSQMIDGTTRSVTLTPQAVDAARQMVHFDRALSAPLVQVGTNPDSTPLLAPFDLTRPIRIESVEFDFDIYRAGKLEQSLRGLSPHPDHSQSITGVFAQDSRWLHLTPFVQRNAGTAETPDWVSETPEMTNSILQATDWTDANTWPSAGTYALSGGTDGLQDLEVSDYQSALTTISRIAEAALIAAPDLVMPDALPRSTEVFTPSIVDCTDLTPPPQNVLNGVISGVDATGAPVPLASVIIDPAGRGQTVRSDPAGHFTLTGLEPGIVTLKLSKDGYEDLEFLAQSSPFASSEAVEIAMTPLTQPRIFGADAVLSVQAMMADPGTVGPYKVAILDVPAPDLQLSEITTWRARLGDLPRAALVGPWLRLPDAAAPAPASCHLCGATASAERSIGVHRSGANLALRHVEGTTLALDDAAHGWLNDAHVTPIIVRPGRGIRAGGARSLAADSTLRYLSTRRILDVLERTLEQVLQPMVFEPNTLFTRQAILLTASSLLTRMWQIGALSGNAPEQAFTVKCDLENNPDESRAAGRLIVDIGVAPTIPMEFIYFRLGHIRDTRMVTEDAQ